MLEQVALSTAGSRNGPIRVPRGTATVRPVLNLLEQRRVPSVDCGWPSGCSSVLRGLEDSAALAWYRQQGFHEQFRYLHVYKNGEESAAGFTALSPLSAPVLVFCHAQIEYEAEVRSRFDRVYICTQFLREVSR